MTYGNCRCVDCCALRGMLRGMRGYPRMEKEGTVSKFCIAYVPSLKRGDTRETEACGITRTHYHHRETGQCCLVGRRRLESDRGNPLSSLYSGYADVDSKRHENAN